MDRGIEIARDVLDARRVQIDGRGARLAGRLAGVPNGVQRHSTRGTGRVAGDRALDQAQYKARSIESCLIHPTKLSQMLEVR
jgi:hypothetical protein